MIDESLQRLGVPAAETEEYLTRTLLALRGWAGMIWQMETNAEWAVHPAPRGSLIGYVAVRLLLLRLAIEYVARTQLGESGDLTELRAQLRAANLAIRGRSASSSGHFWSSSLPRFWAGTRPI